MVAGDLNITPFSQIFFKFLQHAQLVDTGRGQGWQPTWFSRMPWFAIPIDHVLCSEKIQVFKRKTGPAMGSDHNPLIVEFNLLR